MVDFCANTVTAKEGMNLEGKVENGTACRHGFNFTLRCKDENFRSKEIQFN